MTTFDLSPLYRTTVGFDRLASLINNAAQQNQSTSYPPYNIEVTGENAYAITLAVAGFTQEDLDIQSEQGVLTVSAKKPVVDNDREFLHQGIGMRNFERKFQLADHVEVTGADLQNGLLTISLVKEIPEAMKPRKIDIGSPRQVDHQAA